MTAALLGLAWGSLVAWPVARRAVRAPARRRASGLATVGDARRGEPVRGVPGIRWTHRERWARWATRPGVRVVVAGVTRRRPDRSTGRGAPLALDLVTMAARAGFTPRLALATGARWAPVDVAAALARVERRCVLGASLTEALADLGAEVPALRGLADALVVAERNGAPVGEVLGRVADELRVDLRRRAEAHARRVPVRLLFPLVFLALPAFGLLTVVPTLVAGLRQP